MNADIVDTKPMPSANMRASCGSFVIVAILAFAAILIVVDESPGNGPKQVGVLL
jgi:hypothetical protein